MRVAQRFEHALDVDLPAGEIGAQRGMRVRGAVGIDERVAPAVDVAHIAVDDVDDVRGQRKIEQRADRDVGGGPALRLVAAIGGEGGFAVNRVQFAPVVEVETHVVERVHVRREHRVGSEAHDPLPAFLTGHHEPVQQENGTVAHAHPQVDRRRVRL